MFIFCVIRISPLKSNVIYLYYIFSASILDLKNELLKKKNEAAASGIKAPSANKVSYHSLVYF